MSRQIRRRVHRDDRGFTLLELLTASALVVVLAAAAAAVSLPIRRAVARASDAADAHARARTAMHAIIGDARAAGTGLALAPGGRALSEVLPVLETVSSSRLAITRASGPQGFLADAAAAGDLSVRIDAARPCTGQDATCGIRPHDTVVITDGVRAESSEVAGVTGGTVHLSAPLTRDLAAGAVIAAIERTQVVLRDGQLVRISHGGAQQPIADRLSEFVARLDAACLDVYLRLASDAAVPGLELRASLALRR